MVAVLSGHHLPDGVHGQLRRPNVDGADARVGREYGPDGASARRAVGHEELLALDLLCDVPSGVVAYGPEEGGSEGLGGLVQIEVGLEHDSLAHEGLVHLLMLVRVVGVACVSAIDGHVHRASDGHLEALRVALGDVSPDALQDFRVELTVGPLQGPGAHLLVVLEEDQVCAQGVVGCRQQSRDRRPARQLVVYPGRAELLVTKPHEPRLVEV